MTEDFDFAGVTVCLRTRLPRADEEDQILDLSHMISMSMFMDEGYTWLITREFSELIKDFREGIEGANMTAPLVQQRSIDQRFRDFHADNPGVYTELVAMTRQIKAKGYRQLGIELIWSAYRWNRMLHTSPDEYGFKLNDHFRSRYARLIMAQEPDLANFFHTRTLRTP